MLTLWNDVDRLFDAWGPYTDRRNAPVRPSYDVEERDDHYVLHLEMPGVARDKLSIEMKENTLTVAAERGERKFNASFTLPAHVDAAKVEADYVDGILSIRLPKAEAAKPRQVKVNFGEASGNVRVAS